MKKGKIDKWNKDLEKLPEDFLEEELLEEVKTWIPYSELKDFKEKQRQAEKIIIEDILNRIYGQDRTI